MRKSILAIIGWILVFLVTFTLTALLHEYGTMERGYAAIGGEVLFLSFPLLLLAFLHDEKRYRLRSHNKKKENT